MTTLVAFVSGFCAYKALSKLVEYFQQRNQRQQVAANPFLNQITYSNQNKNSNSEWEHCETDLWHKSRQSNPQNLEPTMGFQLDTENTMNIAVCGNSGTGKSTFINCIRGIGDVEIQPNFNHKQDGPAAVGIMETTKTIMPYQWPKNSIPYITLWDLPCASIITNPEKTYFNKFQLHRFDCLLLLRAGRFTEFDAGICQQAFRHKLPIVLVLNKSDQDVINNKKRKIRQLKRQLTPDELKQVITETMSALKANALAELQAIPTNATTDCASIPMFVVAPQSYRDQLNNVLDPDDSPSLETHDLVEFCINTIVDYRKNQDQSNN